MAEHPKDRVADLATDPAFIQAICYLCKQLVKVETCL